MNLFRFSHDFFCYLFLGYCFFCLWGFLEKQKKITFPFFFCGFKEKVKKKEGEIMSKSEFFDFIISCFVVIRKQHPSNNNAFKDRKKKAKKRYKKIKMLYFIFVC
jgi:hypothetical protein